MRSAPSRPSRSFSCCAAGSAPSRPTSSRSARVFVANTWLNARFTWRRSRPRWLPAIATLVGALALTTTALLVIRAIGGGVVAEISALCATWAARQHGPVPDPLPHFRSDSVMVDVLDPAMSFDPLDAAADPSIASAPRRRGSARRHPPLVARAPGRPALGPTGTPRPLAGTAVLYLWGLNVSGWGNPTTPPRSRRGRRAGRRSSTGRRMRRTSSPSTRHRPASGPPFSPLACSV